jgi:hypothetical protein
MLNTTTVSGMRHIGTLIAAFVIGPSAWILLAFGQDRSVQAFAHAQSASALHTGDFVRPVEYLAAAGLLLGLLATLRFSPLGSVVTGLGYTFSYVLLLVAPKGLMDLFNHHFTVAGRPFDPATPIRTGTTLVLGALMLVATLSVGRWRRRPRLDDEPFDEFSDRDRPVGVDGLGLTPPGRGREPELVSYARSEPEPVRFGRSIRPLDATTAQPAAAGRPAWPWGSSRPDGW